jgi:CRP-like cAMP-binding protein
MRCQDCPSREKCEWSVLNDAELELINRSKQMRAYDRGDTIYLEDDEPQGLYCLMAGSAAVLKTDEEGEIALLHIADAGETLGYRSLLSNDTHSTTCEAITRCTVCAIPGSVVRQLLEVNPKLGLGFFTHAAREMREVAELHLRTVTGTIRLRLAYFLMTQRKNHGKRQNGDLVIDLPVSKQEIAAMIGIRPETLSREIQKMRSDGIADFMDHSVKISNPDEFFRTFENA